ncbi:MAG: hypothetical protein U1E29_07300, partial [Coriobacteriia bacterium]|nr:hypothetical protein [Coriobacteriia bacterium]
MSLRLITGSARADKAGIAFAELIERAGHGDSAALLLPAVPDVSRALAQLASRASVGLAISTFDDFLDHLWAAHGDGRVLVTPVQRMALLAESARTRSQRTDAPGKAPGFLRTLSTVVQRAAETVDELSGLPAETGAAAEIVRCAAGYAELLNASGFVERGEAHRRVSGLLTAPALPDLIAISGFTGLTRSQ